MALLKRRTSLNPYSSVWIPVLGLSVLVEQPLQETVELMEDIVVEYLTEIVSESPHAVSWHAIEVCSRCTSGAA